MREEVLYELALSFVPSLGPVGIKDLMQEMGSAKEVFYASKPQLQKVSGIGPIIAKNIKSTDYLALTEKEMKFCEDKHIDILSYFHSEHFPHNLKNCYDSPVILYHIGNVHSDKRLHVGIVGTRDASEYGKKVCVELVKTLAPYNPIIVSGLAMGIDFEAHRQALRSGLDTIAIVAHGLDTVYPREHYNIALEIVKQGAIITEFGKGIKPNRENFPARNRIIAGICNVIVVVEAKEKGGALITADIANSYGRDVFTFPGRIYDKRSAGCNNLIKQNVASIIIHPNDIVQALGLELKTPVSIQKSML